MIEYANCPYIIKHNAFIGVDNLAKRLELNNSMLSFKFNRAPDCIFCDLKYRKSSWGRVTPKYIKRHINYGEQLYLLNRYLCSDEKEENKV